MTLPLTAAPAAACTTFMNFPLHTDLSSLEAEVAIRAQSGRIGDGLDRWDFDLGGPLFDGRKVRVVDCGDVPGASC